MMGIVWEGLPQEFGYGSGMPKNLRIDNFHYW